MKCFSAIFFLLIINSSSLFSQVDDTLQLIEEVKVSIAIVRPTEIRIQRDRTNALNEQDIRLLAANDAGELVAKMVGANLRSYGGLGGLKTVSVRSLGSGHTTTAVDGFILSNQQTGQINLGAIPSDNIVGAKLLVGSHVAYLSAVSSQISGSTIALQTFENTFSRDSLQIRASVQQGSFDQKGGYLAIKHNRAKYFVSAFGKYRNAVGNYSFHYLNGSHEVKDVRKNNDYLDYYYGASFGARLKNGNTRFGIKGSGIEQGLPGAVVFYAGGSDERLETNSIRTFGDLDGVFKDFFYRVYSSYDVNRLNYLDPTYLYNNGGIDVSYTNADLRTGASMVKYYPNRLEINGGIEHCRSTLLSSDSSLGMPIRNHFSGILGAKKIYNLFTLWTSVSTQFVKELNRLGENGLDRIRVNPFIKIERNGRRRNELKQQLWYRNSFRMPTFNELYYNNIGNVELLPELANQFNYGLDLVPLRKSNRIELYVRSNVYFNSVKNKILATPTKNLFVWSMQNVEKVHVYGAEVYFNFNFKAGDFHLDAGGNYTYQRVIDRTESSLTFGHQLAYSPEHMSNLDMTFKWKKSGIRISNNYTSMRYSLNENIPMNQIEGFYLLDLAIFQAFKINNEHELRVQFNVKNVLNSSYAYIRSYIMPGTNYLISLSYAFN